jgi:hypothetical protein
MTKRASKIKMHKITNVIKIIVEIFIKKREISFTGFKNGPNEYINN